jgi:hypothetical protein
LQWLQNPSQVNGDTVIHDTKLVELSGAPPPPQKKKGKKKKKKKIEL